MFDLPAFIQLPIGFSIGLASVLAPWLLRPFLIVALTIFAVQAGVLYAAGGTAALSVGLSWVTLLVRDFGLLLAGVGVGRIGTEILFGRR